MGFAYKVATNTGFDVYWRVLGRYEKLASDLSCYHADEITYMLNHKIPFRVFSGHCRAGFYKLAVDIVFGMIPSVRLTRTPNFRTLQAANNYLHEDSCAA